MRHNSKSHPILELTCYLTVHGVPNYETHHFDGHQGNSDLASPACNSICMSYVFYLSCIFLSHITLLVNGMIDPAVGVLYAHGISSFALPDNKARRHSGDRVALWYVYTAKSMNLINCDLFSPQVFRYCHPLDYLYRIKELFFRIFCIGADFKAAFTEL